MDAPVDRADAPTASRPRWGVWHTRADLLPSGVRRRGRGRGRRARCCCLPSPTPGAARAVVARLDGLVDPRRRRRRPGARTAPSRTSARPAGAPTATPGSSRCSTAADAVGLPVLGVCRGMQLMAVHAGGTLDQHTPDLVGHERAQPRRRRLRRGRRSTTEPGSPGRAAWSATRLDGAAATTTSPCATHPGFTAVGPRGRRDARGDGGRRATGSASPCSGTRRRGSRSACWPGLVDGRARARRTRGRTP